MADDNRWFVLHTECHLSVHVESMRTSTAAVLHNTKKVLAAHGSTVFLLVDHKNSVPVVRSTSFHSVQRLGFVVAAAANSAAGTGAGMGERSRGSHTTMT